MVRLLCIFCVLWGLTLQVEADEKAKTKPNTLTQKEVAEGWISLFDGETTSGWKINGEAKIERNCLVLGGEKETTITTKGKFGEFKFQCNYLLEGKCFRWQLNETTIDVEPNEKPASWGTGYVWIDKEWFRPSFAQIKGGIQQTSKTGNKLTGNFPISFHIRKCSQLWLQNIKLQPLGLRKGEKKAFEQTGMD